MTSAWNVSEMGGAVAALHGPLPSSPSGVASAWPMAPTDAAVVLGSGQAARVVDAAAAASRGLGICHRRSGGGLVVIDPASCRWVDLHVPTGHPLWCGQVDVAFDWLGATWVRALAARGVEASAHRGPILRRGAGRIVCFAGIARGEVHLAGRKLVGISQRRDRAGARFQCIVYSDFDVARHLALLASPADRDAVGAALTDSVATVAEPDALVDAFLAALP